ncbi:MAG TPA: hypothetical protein PLQ35_06525, partial [bacterium]|nr:hypothetical protein [bacterium]
RQRRLAYWVAARQRRLAYWVAARQRRLAYYSGTRLRACRRPIFLRRSLPESATGCDVAISYLYAAPLRFLTFVRNDNTRHGLHYIRNTVIPGK